MHAYAARSVVAYVCTTQAVHLESCTRGAVDHISFTQRARAPEAWRKGACGRKNDVAKAHAFACQEVCKGQRIRPKKKTRRGATHLALPGSHLPRWLSWGAKRCAARCKRAHARVTAGPSGCGMLQAQQNCRGAKWRRTTRVLSIATARGCPQPPRLPGPAKDCRSRSPGAYFLPKPPKMPFEPVAFTCSANKHREASGRDARFPTMLLVSLKLVLACGCLQSCTITHGRASARKTPCINVHCGEHPHAK